MTALLVDRHKRGRLRHRGEYIDDKGYKVEEKNRVVNEYFDEFKKKWQPTKNNLNPSLPKIVTPE